jgi:hypothetical protein
VIEKTYFYPNFKSMNATIGIYDNHDLAVEAVQKLKDQNFPVNEVSIIGLTHTEDVDKSMHITEHNPIKAGGLATGAALGTTLGVLTGIGMFAIPGVGFLYAAGALVGAVAGFDFGLIGGGIASAISTTMGIRQEESKKYHDALAQGKFLVVVHGAEKEVNTAKEMLAEHGTHSDIQVH